MKSYLIGIDIGGTKCAVSLGTSSENGIEIVKRAPAIRTKDYAVGDALDALLADVRGMIAESSEMPKAIGISCGGPLDSKRGIIQSPPNLPGWDDIHATEFFTEKTGVPTYLCNDANACALAEWKAGAGRGCENMLFLTFGTGLGAGIILDGRLIEGASGYAGEAGHIRLAEHGPSGYGKAGSFEGFCSGGGIAQLAENIVRQHLQRGEHPALCPNIADLDTLTAEKVGKAAKAGDAIAVEIMNECGKMLGYGLSILIDLFNPERIVIGSIFMRAHDELWPEAKKVIDREALPMASAVCEVVPAGLTESVGDIAALTVAAYHIEKKRDL